MRLYSIAASRYGDTFDGKTTSFCVRRAEFWDPETNAYDPAKKGICSNYLCDAKPGTEINMTGIQILPRTAHCCQATPNQCCARSWILMVMWVPALCNAACALKDPARSI